MTEDGRLEMRCREFTAAASDYLENVLEPGLRKAFEEHEEDCVNCHEYLDQLSTIIRGLRAAAHDDVSDEERAKILRLLNPLD